MFSAACRPPSTLSRPGALLRQSQQPSPFAMVKPDTSVALALGAASISLPFCADAFAPQRAAHVGTTHRARENHHAVRPLHSSYLDSLSAPPPQPDQSDMDQINDQQQQPGKTGIQTYLDTMSVLDGITDGYGAGSTNTAPYLNAMNEVCDADHAATRDGEPSVECADAIADYLDVVTETAGGTGQAYAGGGGQQDDDYILQAILDANVHHQYQLQEQPQQQQYQPQRYTYQPTSIQDQPNYDQQYQQPTPEQPTYEEQTSPITSGEDMEDQYLKMVSNEVSVKRLNKQNPYAITDIPIDTMISRVLDNIEDATQKNNGKTKGKSFYKLQKQPSEERPTVVVLGTGWAAHAFTKLASTYDLRIVVVSPVNHFVFTPMLASASVGTIEYRSSEYNAEVRKFHVSFIFVLFLTISPFLSLSFISDGTHPSNEPLH